MRLRELFVVGLIAVCGIDSAHAQVFSGDKGGQPWMNQRLSADERADLVLKRLSLDEKIQLLHGNGMRDWGMPNPNAYLGNGGSGFVLGFPQLGIPAIQMSDAAYGLRYSAVNGRYATALPSDLGAAASWDPLAACDYGTLIGRELRAQGFNMSLGGGVNLTRDARNGRTFEYQGEDPVLAGTMVGNRIRCEQAQHILGDIKHFAMNDQEVGRNTANVVIGKRAMMESDLLAFRIGLRIGNPGAVMCAYNAVNGDFACENRYLLTDVLKKQWGFKGFVFSDWGGTHSTAKASAAGLDNEQPEDIFYGPRLKAAVEKGTVLLAELDDHARRVLRSEFASGIVDYPAAKSVVDVDAGFNTSLRLAEQSIVLLKNSAGLLPLDRAKTRSIAVIGINADTGMISGGGSAQVDPEGRGPSQWQEHVWFPTSPLKAIQQRAAGASVRFAPGSDPEAAAALARESDVAIVFAYQWSSEDMDLPSLSLPENQDALIARVAAANPRTIVVLETGTAVTMPWLPQVDGVLEAWYAGSKGADAVAKVLFGDVNPSAKLPITFPMSEADLPHPAMAAPPPGSPKFDGVAGNVAPRPQFTVSYDEGLLVGYKWYDAMQKRTLFPFGFGLSYTTFAYSGLSIVRGAQPTVGFTVRNTGKLAGEEIAEVYAALPSAAAEPPKRLVGWAKLSLGPGESRAVELSIDSLYLSIYDEPSGSFKMLPGTYTFMVGGSSRDLPLKNSVDLK